jgi:hypothetical protein
MKRSDCWHLGAGFLVLASHVVCGCSAIPKSSATSAAPVTPTAVRLAYRTASDRLNVAGAGIQLASDQHPASGPLPGFSTATLIITSPHPGGIPGYALATLVIKPEQAEPNSALALWPWAKSSVTGSKGPPDVAAPREVWVLDIPQWQVDAVVAKLQNANFFQRSRVLDADVFLAAEVGPQKNAKNCKSLPELDAVILRSRAEGRFVSLLAQNRTSRSCPNSSRAGPSSPEGSNGSSAP